MIGTTTDVVGVIGAAIGAGALIYIALHLARRAGHQPPGWVLPAGIGLAMIAYSIWNDYAWFARAADRLPSGSQVLVEGRQSQPWAPWTYLAPTVVRFAALDPATITDAPEGTRHADIMLIERRGPTHVVPQEFDCAGRRIRPARGDWGMAAPDDPAFAAVCAGSQMPAPPA